MSITQTQLLEWVKDGNIETLNEYFSTQLKFHKEAVSAFFEMRDDSQRNVIHWAAFLGQYQLLQWWCQDFQNLIDLNQGEMHDYTAIELASIRGYSDEYSPSSQEETIRLLVAHGAEIRTTADDKPNALHWAYYYGNKSIIEFLISKNFQLQFEMDQDRNFPVDYLFLENRPLQYQQQYKQLFQDTVSRYVSQTDSGRTFQDMQKHDKKKTMKISLNQEQVSNPVININQDYSPESEPSKNDLPQSNISHYHRSQTSNSFVSRQTNNKTMPKGGSHPLDLNKFQSKVKCQKLIKPSLDNDIPLYDSENELHEPEEEKIPEIKIIQNNIANNVNTVNNINNSKLISEQAVEEQFKNDFDPKVNKLAKNGDTIFQQQKINQLELPSRSIKTKIRTSNKKVSKTSSQKFVIYNLNQELSDNNRFEQRLQYWSARLGYSDFLLYFLEKKCNPFRIVNQGYNCLHIAAYKGKHRILRNILENDYQYEEQQDILGKKKKKQENIFDKIEAINLLTESNPSNALHLAIEQENYHCMKTLIQHGVSVDVVNHRCLKPFELTYNQRILTFYRENIQNKNQIKSFTDLGYQYVIQTKGLTSVEQDIVYIQLQNIRQTFKERGWKFEFIIFNVPDLSKLDQYKDPVNGKRIKPVYHYYVIKLSPDTIYRLADLFGIQSYNFKTKHICQFKYDQHMFFEFPKDLQVQMLLLNTLNDEFDVDKFMLEKLIIDHFPLEDHAKSEKISQFWHDQQNNCIRDSFRYETQQIALRPLHAIASYYGPVIAWYIALNVQIIGWLMVPALIGAAIGLYIVVENNLNSPVIPFYALLMTLWSTLFMEKWKNRESELRFCWDMHKFKQSEPQRVMYTGQYVINEATSKIEIYDYFTTFKRRLIAEGPVICLGIFIIVISFYAFLIWQEYQEKQDKNNIYMPIIINSLNGVSMTVLCDLYKRLCSSLVTWENHRYQSEQEYSYILKVFLFEFLISYISVVYVAIFKDSATQLSISVASIIITRGVISNLTSNVLPYLIYKFLHKHFFNKFEQFKQIYRQKLNDPSIIDQYIDKSVCPRIVNQNFISDKLDQETQLEFLTQLEETRIKQPQKILYDEYTSIAIQFGYTTMFAPAFPAAPLFFMINCYINLKFSIYNYQKILKRERAQAADSIGIWLPIFEIMNYSATFMNCIVIGTVNKAQFSGLIGNNDPLVIAFALTAIEHILILIKYILDVVIPDSPYWVEKELRKYAYLEAKQDVVDELDSKKLI